MNATEAKKEFLQLLDRCGDTPFLITRNGKPVAVLLDADEYERIMETVKFYAFSEASKKFGEQQKDKTP